MITPPAILPPEHAARQEAPWPQEAPYAPPVFPGPIDLWLDANESPSAAAAVEHFAPWTHDRLRRYPDARPLEAQIAARLGIPAPCVLVTAGGDDAIDRVCRVSLRAGRQIVLPVPTFEMITRSAARTGAEIREVAWPDATQALPLDHIKQEINDRTGVVAIVSPNNPTGAVATAQDLVALSAAAPHATLLVDLAYTEFADTDLTHAALALPNAVIVRTFSKAYGLAGLRIGYAAGPESTIRAMRAAGSPYPASSPALGIAAQALVSGQGHISRVVERVRAERDKLVQELESLGARADRSQGNFVLARTARAEWVWQALGGLGIAVRKFTGRAGLDNALRVTCPGNSDDLRRLCSALRAALRPEAVLLHLDAALADVPGSRQGAIARRFDRLPRGNQTRPGLPELEQLIPAREGIERLASRLRLGIVTGSPRRDVHHVLDCLGLRSIFACTICMEDAPANPGPAPVLRALEQLGVRSAWMVGHAPDDMVAARRAGVVPIGLLQPGSDHHRAALAATLESSGAARVLTHLDQITELLP